MSKILKIGTRPSPLALKQVEEIGALFPDVGFEIVKIKTRGDRDKLTPISLSGAGDFFTFDLEQALLDKRIDAAIHSAKDLEKNIPDGLIVAAVTKCISPYECLVSNSNLKLAELPAGSRVGTSSKIRKEALARHRKDLLIKDIRGTIEERLRQLDKGDFEAIIVAHAALIRLGITERIAEIIPVEIIQPHPLQGRLAVEVRKDNRDLFRLFRRIHDKKAG